MGYSFLVGCLMAPSWWGRIAKVHTCEGLSQQRLALSAGVCRTRALGCPGARVSPAWRAERRPGCGFYCSETIHPYPHWLKLAKTIVAYIHTFMIVLFSACLNCACFCTVRLSACRSCCSHRVEQFTALLSVAHRPPFDWTET